MLYECVRPLFECQLWLYDRELDLWPPLRLPAKAGAVAINSTTATMGNRFIAVLRKCASPRIVRPKSQTRNLQTRPAES